MAFASSKRDSVGFRIAFEQDSGTPDSTRFDNAVHSSSGKAKMTSGASDAHLQEFCGVSQKLNVQTVVQTYRRVRLCVCGGCRCPGL